MSAWSSAFERVPELLLEHVQISFAALALGIALSVPLAVLAHRNRWFASAILGFASFVQTIPSLALLALFFPILVGLGTLLGDWVRPLGFLPALLALTLYALLPILRNAVTGLAAVDPAAREAADGLGMTAIQKLWLVELPLALTTIVAGVRTAAVWTIGAATLATTVGQPSLGDLIFAGLQTQNWPLVLVGCGVSAALALSVDVAIGFANWGIAHRWRWTAATLLGGFALVMAAVLTPMLLPKGDVIVIGGKGFSEQYILQRLIGARLEAAGYDVEYRDGLGSAVVFGALSSGDIDISVDYAGTLWASEMKRSDTLHRAAMLAEIGRWTDAQSGARIIGGLGFENAYAFAVTPETAQRYGLATLNDLARAAPQLTLGTDPEFLERTEWASVERVYGMRFRTNRSFSPSFMYDALASGEADVITAYTSDGRVAADRLVVLSDPEQAIPGYDALLMVNARRMDDTQLMAALRPLVGGIRVEDMRTANYLVDRPGNKRTPVQAAAWLAGRLAPPADESAN